MKRTIAMLLLAALLLTLTACAAETVPVEAPAPLVDDTPRILTPLTPGLHDPYVLLADGYASFGTYWPGYRLICGTGRGLKSEKELQYSEIQDFLGYDILAELAALPPELRMTEEDIYPYNDRIVGSPFEEHEIGYIHGGYSFVKVGEALNPENEKFPHPYRKLTLSVGRLDSWFCHPGEGVYDVVGWNLEDEEDLEMYPDIATRSRVGNVEVSFLYCTDYAANYTDHPDARYYAGFIVDDVGYALLSEYGYCTQEEFLLLALALIDAAVAHAETVPTADELLDAQPMLRAEIHDPFLELSEGYAAFNENPNPEAVYAQLQGNVDATLKWRLGFDPVDALQGQPEHMALRSTDKVKKAEYRRDGPDHLTHKRMGKGSGVDVLAVNSRYLGLSLSWDAIPDIPGIYYSYINGTEVLLLHSDPLAAMWPDEPLARLSYWNRGGIDFDEPQNCYFAAFTCNGVTVALYAHNGYCTQEEFLNAVTALVEGT